MTQVSHAAAFLIGAFLECMMYAGIFVPFFIAARCVQRKKISHGRKIDHVMAFATMFPECTVAADCVLALRRSLQAILYTLSGMSVYEYLNGPWPIVEVARLAVFQLQIVVADVIIVYRMFHIYDKNSLVVEVIIWIVASSYIIPVFIARTFWSLSSMNTGTAFFMGQRAILRVVCACEKAVV